MCGELAISLKNKIFPPKFFKKLRNRNDYSQFQAKIFLRTVLLAAFAFFAIIWLYSFFLQGHFANGVVAVYQKLFHMDYYDSLDLYRRTFRNHMTQIFTTAIVLVFFIVFRIYLKWFTKYFAEINEGMNSLIREDAGEIFLSPELLPIERKMNTIKHTIAEQKREMLVAEQQKNDLIMYLAHDLKTPLASVIGYLNLLRDETQISEELREKYLSVSLDKAERLEDLINEFFEIAKFNLSHITLQYSRINLTRLLEMLLYEFQPMFQEKHLNCNLSIAEDTMLRCDADKIQRVFDNLLKNAVIYSFEGTDIDIIVTEQGENIVIQFINHGDTIPKEKLERIFEQFYRLDAARSTGSGGAGLGLAIAKQIIELHHGTITARSEDERIVFEVRLPMG